MGSMKAGSSSRRKPRSLGLRSFNAVAAISPSATEIPIVANANPTELRTAATGGT